VQTFCLEETTIQTATLTLCRFDRPLDRVWVFAQMGFARLPLRRTPGLEFFRLMGSGTGEGFTPIPNTAVWSILAVWKDEDSAEKGLNQGVFAKWSARATESCHLKMTTQTARGAWGGVAPFRSDDVEAVGPLAVLTRATVQPSRVLRFWRRVPDISARIGRDPAVLLKIGVGEVPWLHQVTFSVWPDATTMAAFARTGPHADAIRAVREGNWFQEELYARFRVTGASGTWEGRALEEVFQ
jgi:spheroidene monooxygenase